MSINDQATLVVSTGRFYTAPVGTEFPTDLTSIPSEWEDMGHTSLDEVLGFDSEGGEATTLGTLQAPQHRTKHSPRIESFNLSLHQFDERGLKLFYGSNAPTTASGRIGAPTNPTPTETAWLAVLRDGPKTFPIYAPRAEIFRADNVDISDTENLASLPLKVTPLQHESNEWLFEVDPLGGTP